jgi:LuxR family transcriptional regulator
MFVDRAKVDGKGIAPKTKDRALGRAANPLSLDVAAIATSGHYLALRIGFAFPVEEVNALPSAWVEEYSRSGFAPFDPLIRWVFSEQGSKRWSAVAQSDPRGVLLRAQAHGLRFGAVTSVLDAGPSGQRSYGSFARHDREFTDEEIALLGEFLLARHEAMRPPRNITEAEIEAMRLVKEGQRLKQIAFQLGVTEGAVKQRLKNARVKLAAKTGAEAISRAATFGLI